MSPSSYSGSRALVLGAAGFIGRWVVRALRAGGADVVGVVRDREQAAVALRGWGDGQTLLEADLSQKGSAADVIGRVSPDIVFNLVGYGVDRTERDPQLSLRLNAELVFEVATAAGHLVQSRWEGQKVVHTGSALEYGDNGGWLREEGPVSPHTEYGRTKLAGTQALTSLVEKGPLKGVTARLFTVYGLGEHEGRLLPSLMTAALEGTEVALSKGEQRRDFTWVGDVAAGLLRLGALSSAAYPVVNLATGHLTTVRGFAEQAARALGLRLERLRFGALPDRPDEMPHEEVSVARLRELTGWVPSTSIADGVDATLRMRREILEQG